VILGVAFWIGWHVWQIKFEANAYDEDKKLLGGKEGIAKVLRDGRLDD
jgi:predicted negative regulator of RcsB-dependent stress response